MTKPRTLEVSASLISDVITAAGLLRHGNQSKVLADRIGRAAFAALMGGLPKRETPFVQAMRAHVKSQPKTHLALTQKMLSAGLDARLPDGSKAFNRESIHSFDDVEAVIRAVVAAALEDV